MTIEVPAIRLVRDPPAWAPPPEKMSFSKLRQIESCPRRWALTASDYPQIWRKRGYPEPLVPATIVGRVTHRAIEIIVKEFHRRGCVSFDDAQAITAMRELGGFSSVIEKSLDDILSQFADNPRVSEPLEVVKRVLHERRGKIREDVRILLSRMLGGRRTLSRDSSQSQGLNGPLGNGIHPEVRLVNEEMKWEGIADLIRLSSTECEIRDFKTGAPKEEHVEQLRSYSLLWLLDDGINPAGRPASKLTISYVNTDVDVPPLSASEVSAFKDELMTRTKTALEKTAGCPPDAMPRAENCRRCVVRHLCGAYWEKPTIEMLARDCQLSSLLDVEVHILGDHGSRSYDAVSIASTTLPPDIPVLLRFSGNTIGCTEGNRLRLLDVIMRREQDEREDDGRVIISTAKFSEVYIVGSCRCNGTFRILGK